MKYFYHHKLRSLYTDIILSIVFSLVTVLAFGQEEVNSSKADSLIKVIETAQNDTNKVNTLNLLSRELLNTGNYDGSVEHAKKSILIAKKINFEKGKADAYNNLGIIYFYQGDYQQSLENYFISLKIRKESGDQQGIATSYNNIGIIYDYQGNYPEALNAFFKALKMTEKLLSQARKQKNADKIKLSNQGIANAYNNIGNIYASQTKNAEALKNYESCLRIMKEIGDPKGIATCYNNIGLIYSEEKEFEKALISFDSSLQISNEIGDKRAVATIYNNIGFIYAQQRKYTETLQNYFESLKMREELGDKWGIASCYSNIGNVYVNQNKVREGREWLVKALQLSRKIGSKESIENSYMGLSKADSLSGDFKNAYTNYRMYIIYRDSILNEESKEKSMQANLQYQFDKKAAEDSIVFAKKSEIQSIALEKKNIEVEKQEAELQAGRSRQYMLYGGLGLVLLFAGFMYNRFKITQKQKQTIEEQKIIVEEKSKEILDSINYAKRIQEAIIPSTKMMEEHLKNGFVFFKPKDVVSGDFYWLEKTTDAIFLAVADCTGHGVPGAMVSVVCHNALNRSVREFGLTETGKILDKTKELVLEQFDKGEEDVKDGMDISLCKFKILNNATISIQWSGANNPLWYSENGIIKEIKADKQAVGKGDQSVRFTSHTINLPKGSALYFFTDGYADQFGGPKGKKLMYKRFKELLDEIHEKEMNQQKTILEDYFNSWRLWNVKEGGKGIEQVDDVCVIGVRI